MGQLGGQLFSSPESLKIICISQSVRIVGVLPALETEEKALHGWPTPSPKSASPIRHNELGVKDVPADECSVVLLRAGLTCEPRSWALCFRYPPRARHIRRPVCAAPLVFERRSMPWRAAGIWRPDLANRLSVRTWVASVKATLRKRPKQGPFKTAHRERILFWGM